MVTSITSLGRTGLQDWLLQRISAVVLVAYVVILGCEFWGVTISHDSLKGFFGSALGQWSTLLAIIAVLVHAWVGFWIILTDYIKPPMLRALMQFGVIALLVGQVLWAIEILWF